jgi:hypothetical protein
MHSASFLPKLRRLLDEQQVPAAKRKELQKLIDFLEKNEERVNIFDVIHEIGINNMLAGTVTIKRNIVGNLIGVTSQTFDKAGQAILSLVPGTRNKAAFAEIPAIIGGQLKSLPRAFKRGLKFTRFGDTENIINNIVKRIKKIRTQKGPATAAQRAQVRKLTEEIRSELSEKDVTRIAEIRTGRGQAFKAQKVFGSKRRTHCSKTSS